MLNIQKYAFFGSEIQFIVSKKQPVGSAHEVLAESLEIIFDAL